MFWVAAGCTLMVVVALVGSYVLFCRTRACPQHTALPSPCGTKTLEMTVWNYSRVLGVVAVGVVFAIACVIAWANVNRTLGAVYFGLGPGLLYFCLLIGFVLNVVFISCRPPFWLVFYPLRTPRFIIDRGKGLADVSFAVFWVVPVCTILIAALPFLAVWGLLNVSLSGGLVGRVIGFSLAPLMGLSLSHQPGVPPVEQWWLASVLVVLDTFLLVSVIRSWVALRRTPPDGSSNVPTET